MSPITTSFLFESESLEAAQWYVSIFPNSEIRNVGYYNEAGPMPAGTVLAVEFVLDGQEYTAVNFGSEVTFTEAISLRVQCADQDEVDHYWERLSDGGEESQCGWLKDRFGISWQVVPTQLGQFLGDPDPLKAQRAMTAMLKMRKLDLALLREAVADVE